VAESECIRACTNCGTPKPLSEFYFDKRRDRHIAACKTCVLARQKVRRDQHPEKCKAAIASWAKRNRARLNERAAAYRARNPDRAAQARAGWAERNPGKHDEFTRAWRARNPERVRETKAAWRERNRELTREQSKAWKAANPEKARQHVRERRARSMQCDGKLSADIVQKLIVLQKGKCPCCGKPLGEDFHLDHVQPLARGGLNTDANVQLLRSECNHKKHAKDPIDFMQERGFLL
jgi:5-methylcytosine-specific restriction endonuclease McrA